MHDFTHFDSIIIGSGLSGLTCALLLARSGRRVLVLEQHSQPAPVVRGFSRAGIHFDSGFHYAGGLGEGGAFQPLFQHLGLDRKLKLLPFAEQGFDRLKISATGECFSLPVGYRQLKAELAGRFPEVRAGIIRYLEQIEKEWCTFPYLNLGVDIADFSIQSVHGESLMARLQEFAAYPELQSLLSMHSLLYGISPAEASSTLNAQVAGSYYHSVHGIDGGGKALIDGLLELLEEAGVKVRCQAEVIGLLEKSGAAAGVRLASGEELTAPEVIATLNPTLLPGLLPEGVLRPAYLKRLKKMRQTMSAYIYFGKSERPVAALQRSNLFVLPQAGIFTPGADLPLAKRGFFLAAAGQVGGGESCGVVGIVPANYTEVAEFSAARKLRSGGYAAQKQCLAAQMQKMFSESCPELTGLKSVELATPLTLRDYSSAPQGAIYGVGHYIGQYNPHPLTRLPGLYLSGQAISAPGLLGAVVAAYLTCGSILGHQFLRGEIKKCH